MSKTTPKKTPKKSTRQNTASCTPKTKDKTRDRIVRAATDLFAAEGIKGATTREIGKLAGVNESTLFRNFQSKEELLRVVVETTVEEMTGVLSEIQIKPKSLREDLLQYTRAANQRMEQNEAIIRMFIGEADRQREHAEAMMECAKKPLLERLTAYFQEKQTQGEISKKLSLPVVLDIFTGMILIGMLKRSVTRHRYSTDTYLEAVVDTFLHGVASDSYRQKYLAPSTKSRSKKQ